MRRFLLSCWILLCFTPGICAQADKALPLRTIVQFNSFSPGDLEAFQAYQPQLLSERLDIYLLTYPDRANWLAHYDKLSTDARFAAVQFDYEVDFREDPNDEFFDQQPNLARTGFTRAWEEATGGLSPNGDTIVIAVLDAGFDLAHEDLAPSLWRNPGEIPRDGIDNDGNGFVDDVHGWNFREDRSGHDIDIHGTQVIGMLGAKGNNGIGVTGTGWNNRLMVFSISLVSEIIAAYDYIAQQRQRWQDSNGNSGAFVVATNASFGVEGRRCAEFPAWANMYDELGRLGILTAASTANRSWDVDGFGDMPTTCPSEFLLGVTNVGPEDELWRDAAWGAASIDLAAPGQGSFTTRVSDTYGAFGSTSAAAPYVTGAIALLYSVPCPRLEMLVREDPAAAARLVRRTLLQSVAPQPDLGTITVSGGILDVWEAWQQLVETCTNSGVEELEIIAVYPNPARTEIQLEFDDPALGPYTAELFNTTGQLAATFSFPVGSAFPVINRMPVADLPRGFYVLRLRNERQSTATPIILR